MGLLTMSEKERRYKVIFEIVKQDKINICVAFDFISGYDFFYNFYFY